MYTLASGGTRNRPFHWSTEAFVDKPTHVEFSWKRDALGMGALQIHNLQANDTRWVQSVPVSPDTWYRVSGWVKAENIGKDKMGAYISVMGTFNNSVDLRGTKGWQRVGFWVKTGELDTKLQIGCRVGGYSSLNTGRAWFTGISVEAAGVPQAQGGKIYGGDPNQKTDDGTLWMQVMTVLIVVGLALLLWRYVLPPRSHNPP